MLKLDDTQVEVVDRSDNGDREFRANVIHVDGVKFGTLTGQEVNGKLNVTVHFEANMHEMGGGSVIHLAELVRVYGVMCNLARMLDDVNDMLKARGLYEVD